MRDYNFFEGYSRRNRFRLNFSSPVFIFAVVVVVLATISLQMISVNNSLKESIQDKTLQLTTLQEHEAYSVSQRLDQVVGIMKQYDQQASDTLNQLRASDRIGVDFLNQLEAALPDSIEVLSMNVSKEEFMLNCQAPNREVAATLYESLLDTGMFESLQIKSILQGQDEDMFLITLSGPLKVGEIQ